ncbi:Cj0069 family protein [Phenylobacterium sp. J367]|uniref:Cj0069 family protein n=1 Tax=Phenylobacterium sp. J367 TaxID=2898435 RepID=UPI00215096E9|nr:Cj0069 family protein [Phenylobacterium sp. J367]MCR5881298.1 Cj0069 family protein [Phenylobacterium sp. J367]
MPKVAIISRDNPLDLDNGRFRHVAASLRETGLEPIACVYDEGREAEFERELRDCDAALVWVNPVQDGRFRHGLDRLLRAAAAEGVLVSAHPDVIDRMGVKAVLASTAELGWSGDARFYPTVAELIEGFPARLATGPRVLKQNRGHSGIGVWRVELLDSGQVRLIEARDRTRAAEQPLADFLAARADELVRVGGFVDQAYQHRLSDGMVRCYMSGERLAGFGWQKVRALLDPDGEPTPPRTYSGPDDPRFQALRRALEDRWAPALVRSLRLATEDLPALWDADFLLGPKNSAGEDSFVLCEINVSSVSPMPQEAPAAIAATVVRRLSRR